MKLFNSDTFAVAIDREEIMNFTCQENFIIFLSNRKIVGISSGMLTQEGLYIYTPSTENGKTVWNGIYADHEYFSEPFRTVLKEASQFAWEVEQEYQYEINSY